MTGWIGAKKLVVPLAPRSSSAILLQVGQPIARNAAKPPIEPSVVPSRLTGDPPLAHLSPLPSETGPDAGRGAKYVAMTTPISGAEASQTATAKGSAEFLGRTPGSG